MFSELNWLGAIILGLGVLVVGVAALWVIVRAARDRTIARDPFGPRRRRAKRRRRRSRHRPF